MATTLTKVQDSNDVNVRRNFFGGWWHGAFLALGMALAQPTTIVSAFIIELTGSTMWVGGLSTVLTVAAAIPQLFLARWIEPHPRKMPVLLLAIYLRVMSWGALAGLIFAIGSSHTQLLSWVLIALLAIFSIGGGLGGIPYTDIIGKAIPSERRGRFFGGLKLISGPLAIAAAMLAQRILANVAYPNNYALLFGLASLALFVAAFGFWIIREPVQSKAIVEQETWRAYGKRLWTTARHMKAFVIVEMLTGLSLMTVPFYVVYARQELNAPAGAIGWLTLVQILGGAPSNLLWGWLVDHYGSWRMIALCASISTLTPLLAIGLSHLGWIGILPVIFLAGATSNGRSVGFSSVLLELAPPHERPTYSALRTWLLLPAAFFPLVLGGLLQQWPYTVIFVVTASLVGIGAVWAWKLARKEANEKRFSGTNSKR